MLSVIELLRQLLERQAVRRVENGTLSEEEIERLGETLLKLEARMGELKAAFGLGDQELTLDLGPLRDLVSDCEFALMQASAGAPAPMRQSSKLTVAGRLWVASAKISIRSRHARRTAPARGRKTGSLRGGGDVVGIQGHFGRQRLRRAHSHIDLHDN